MTFIRHIIKPGPGRCVVKPLPPDEEYTGPGGVTLWVPRPATHEGTVGEIIDAGQPYRLGTGELMQPNYEVGQIVLLSKYTGMRITLNRSEDFIICKDQDIIGELQEERPLALVTGDDLCTCGHPFSMHGIVRGQGNNHEDPVCDSYSTCGCIGWDTHHEP